jgi:hypothetical protein
MLIFMDFSDIVHHICNWQQEEAQPVIDITTFTFCYDPSPIKHTIWSPWFSESANIYVGELFLRNMSTYLYLFLRTYVLCLRIQSLPTYLVLPP